MAEGGNMLHFQLLPNTIIQIKGSSNDDMTTMIIVIVITVS